MTYDPNNPNRRVVHESDSMSGGMIAGIAFAALLALGVLFWAMSGDRQTASTTTSPPATTGQGAPSPSPAPSTTPAPAPERAPSPAPAPAPEAK